MSKILISILLSLGLCSGGAGVRYFNSNDISHKNVQANQSVSNESSEKVETQQGEESKEETNILSSNPFTKVFENISKNFSKDKLTDTTKKEESVKNTPQDEEAKVESNYENGKLEIIQSHNENKEVAQSNNEEANPSKNKQEEKPVENNKVEKETNKDSVQKQENKPVEQSNNSSSYATQIEQMIFNKVNEERAKAGVAPLSYSNTMQKYARIKSEDMGVRKYFSHEDPNGQLITAKMKADGVSYNAWGENIAYLGGYSGDSNIANQFMTNWMNSSGHRANILSPNFTSIGVGVYKIGNTYYATQEFMK
ncbi:CAP domain-containing protein [Clostridium perfringens]|uniref:CAP domain-containing protein n=1 Tax=Clostridium perfringens TaxID=1502 RepID=UPI0012412CE3|nr:CAP domain-containing protein [Clostridium perfringens]